jgi:uncharacterized protein
LTVAVPWTRDASGLRIAVRLTPRGGRDAIDGVTEGPDGRPALAARVSAPPVEGAANAALEKLIARALGVPRSAARVAKGAGARLKTVEVEGDSAALEIALRVALE